MKNFLYKYKYIIIFLILFSVGLSILYYFNNMELDVNSVSLITFSESNSDSDIVVSNRLPLTDEVGKSIDIYSNKVGTTGYLEFEVKSNVDRRIRYEIYLTKNIVKPEISTKFVKVYLTDFEDIEYKENDKPNVLTYYDLKSMSDDKDSKILYTGTLKEKNSQKFKLRMWVADTHGLSAEDKLFSVKLNVRVK